MKEAKEVLEMKKTDSKIRIGDLVIIQSGWMRGEWGKVFLIDEDSCYHVGLYGRKNDALVFELKDLEKMK